MRQQVAFHGVFVPFDEIARDRPVLAGLVMLQADAAHLVGEGEQEVIMIVVVRAVKFVGLLHQGAMRI